MPLTFPQMPDKLTANEAAVLEYITRNSDSFLFMSIAQLAAALDVSEATISRFARHVGCRDFKHLKQLVLEQTQPARPGPAGKLAATLADGDGALLPRWMEQQRYCLEKTLELLDPAQFDRAAQVVAGAKRVFVYAKNASRSMAELLAFRLRRIGVDVHAIPAGGTELLEGLAPAGPEDLVVVFAFSKLSAEGRVILDVQRAAGYRTLLFTGQLYHGRAPRADIELFVCRGEEKEYHSMTAPAAIVDALVLAVSARLGDAALQNLEARRRLKSEYGARL